MQFKISLHVKSIDIQKVKILIHGILKLYTWISQRNKIQLLEKKNETKRNDVEGKYVKKKKKNFLEKSCLRKFYFIKKIVEIAVYILKVHVSGVCVSNEQI